MNVQQSTTTQHHYLTADEIREAWVQTIANQNSKYHLTITFPKHTSRAETRRLLNRFIRHLNRTIYNRQHRKGKRFLKGFACEEFTRTMNTHHYHIIICDDEYLPEYDRFHSLIHKQIRYLNGMRPRADRSIETQIKKYELLKRVKDESLRKLIKKDFRELLPRHKRNCIQTFKLQEYHNDGTSKLERYGTKSFERMSVEQARKADFIGVLSSGDVEFGTCAYKYVQTRYL